MKRITFKLSSTLSMASVASLLLLAGCESRQPDWSNNCETHFSLSKREMSECLAKVERGAHAEIEPGTVSIDPDNTDRQTYEQMGKGGAGDSN